MFHSLWALNPRPFARIKIDMWPDVFDRLSMTSNRLMVLIKRILMQLEMVGLKSNVTLLEYVGISI